MRAVIIGNGEIHDYERAAAYIRGDDFVICADGGARHAAAMNIVPELHIGDFDSSLPIEGVKKLEYPARKDLTDGEICVRYAAEHGFDEVLMLGMTGSRADHTAANILLLSRCARGCIADDHNEIYYIRDSFFAEGKKGMTLSIIPVKGNMKGVVTEGLEYPLRGEELRFGESRGISNVITEDRCGVTVKGGEGIIVINTGE